MTLFQTKLHMYKKNKFFYLYNKNFLEFLNKKPISFNKKSLNTLISKPLVIKTNINKKNNLNLRIEHSLFNYNIKKEKNIVSYNYNDFTPTWLKNISIINLSEINFSLKKEFLFLHLEKKRQLFYFLKEYCNALKVYNKTLCKEHLPNKDKIITLTNNKWYNIYAINLKLFYNNYLSYCLFKTSFQKKNYNITKNYFLFNKISLPILFQNLYISSFTGSFFKINNESFLPNLFIFYCIIKEKWLAKDFNSDLVYKTNDNYQLYHKKITLIQKKIKAILINRNFINNNVIKYFFRNKNKSLITNIIWKKNNSLFQKNNFSLKKLGTKQFFILPHNRLIPSNNNHFNIIRKNKNRFISFAHTLYILVRLEEKIDILVKNENTKNLANKLIQLYNLLYLKIITKNDTNINSSLILGNLNEMFRIRKTDWKHIFLQVLNQWINKNISIKDKNKNLENINHFFSKLQKKLLNFKRISRQKKNIFKTKESLKKINREFIYNINKSKNFFSFGNTQKKSNLRLNIRKNLLNEKLILNNNYIKFNQHQEALSVLTNKKVKIFFINALSLTKYAFNLERKLEKKEKRSPTTFLQNIDRDMINKYKYIGIYIKDLIRVCFIGMFLKKPTFMAKFIAFQLAKLPRNRKETSFIRFIIKIVKTFAAERDEILGLRIKFKGRVNRWRRTKSILGERGVIPLHSIDNRIECGSAQAINRKGALGIRIWIRYKPSFSTLIKNSIIKYFTYSKKLRLKKKLPRYIYFTRKH